MLLIVIWGCSSVMKTVSEDEIINNPNNVYVYSSLDEPNFLFSLSYETENLLLTVYKRNDFFGFKRYEILNNSFSQNDFGSLYLELTPSEKEEKSYSHIYFGKNNLGKIKKAEYCISNGVENEMFVKDIEGDKYFVLVISNFGISSEGSYQLNKIEFKDSNNCVIYQEELAVSNEGHLIYK